MIRSYEDAQHLHSTTEAERHELENALQVAQNGVKDAIQKLRYARKRLTRAEFRAGRARNMIKKSGFSEILQRRARSVKHQPVVKFDRMLCPSPLFSILHNQCFLEYRLIATPGTHFTIKLDWLNVELYLRWNMYYTRDVIHKYKYCHPRTSFTYAYHDPKGEGKGTALCCQFEIFWRSYIARYVDIF